MYDSRDRLMTMNDGSQSLEYEYDASGIRQAKSVDGVKDTYLVDPIQSYAQVIAHLDNAGNALATYTYGLDRVSQTIGQGINASTTYYHFDGLGSTRKLSDESGSITNAYTYKAFGEVEQKLGITPNDYLFTGEQYDANLGFYYLRARYYNPMNGRMFSLDTYQGNNYDPRSLHKYLYANSSPIVYTDPSGYSSMNLSALNAMGNIMSTLSSIAVPIVQGIKSRAVLSLAAKLAGTAAGAIIVTTVVKRCSKNPNAAGCNPEIPIFVLGFDVFAHTSFVLKAQSQGKSSLLTKRSERHRSNWLKNTPECKGKIGQAIKIDCDEYPYAITHEGGQENYSAGLVALKPLRDSPNRGAGVRLRWFFEKCGVRTDRKFTVVPAPVPKTIGFNSSGKCY